MKKGILIAILALFTGVTLVGCGQKAEENTDSSADTVATQENSGDQSEDEQTDGQSEQEAPTPNAEGDNTQQQGETMSLGEQSVQGDVVEGSIYNGKYRLTNGSDRVVVEWTEDAFKNKTEYIFSGDKLSSISFERTYSDAQQAKSDYETACKQNESAKKAKNLTLEGSTIKYTFEDNEWKEIKDYTKQQIFDEQKKIFDEINKTDDGNAAE